MRILRFIKRFFLVILSLLSVNIGLLWGELIQAVGMGLSIGVGGFFALFFLFFNVLPYRDKNRMGIRLRIMMGGRALCGYSLAGIVLQCFVYLFAYPVFIREQASGFWLAGNAIWSMAAWLFMLWNGILRIFFTSRRLSVKTRLLMLLSMWIPFINLGVLLYALRMVHAEYDFACYKEAVRSTRVESDICRTRYPIIMVHGIGFRDLKYFNYWGRIPKELTRYGATIYYGNQEAVGTIVHNAEDIKAKILEVIGQTGCPKVNIIAHSKGGLDARYAISKLGAEEFVASLTTVCTPHRGCRFVDYACRLPEGLYRFVAGCFDKTFRKIGDKNPDFYTATRQFSTEYSNKFNEEVPDAPGIYYQSYASSMKNCLSDTLLSVPFCLIKPLEGENDGLVSVSSAKWGEFRGVITSSKQRGISHGYMIDLKREDYNGADIVEVYVDMVHELKEKGF